MTVRNSGIEQIVDEILGQRLKFFDGCVSMQTILKISLKNNEVIYALYKSHYLARRVTVVKDGKEMTFGLLDIEGVEKV